MVVRKWLTQEALHSTKLNLLRGVTLNLPALCATGGEHNIPEYPCLHFSCLQTQQASDATQYYVQASTTAAQFLYIRSGVKHQHTIHQTV